MIELPPLPSLPDPFYSEMSVGSMYAEDELEAWARAYGEACARATLEAAAKACDEHAVEPQVMVLSKITDTPRAVHSRECAAAIRFLKVKP